MDALEWLGSYGWALVVIVIVIAALFAFGTFNPAKEEFVEEWVCSEIDNIEIDFPSMMCYPNETNCNDISNWKEEMTKQTQIICVEWVWTKRVAE